MAEQQQLPDNWQPSDELTVWQWDDCMIWDMKTRIQDLEPSNVEIMWRKLQEYRWWIEREEKRAEDTAAELVRTREALDVLRAALEQIAVGSGHKLEQTVFLSSSELSRFYIQRIERMKKIAADALAQAAALGEAGIRTDL